MNARTDATPWTEGEVARLRELAPAHTCDRVAYMLNRTPDSVRGKARALGDVSFNAGHARSRLTDRGDGWTEERVERLKSLWIEGLSAAQIARDLRGVTRNAVIGKIHRLGFSGRATPSRPAKRRVTLAKPRISPAPRFTSTRTPTQIVAEVPLEPLKREDGSVVSILTCDDTTCRFPMGDPQAAGFALCGRPASGRYCAAHDALAYDRRATAKKLQPRAPDRARELERQMRRHAQ